jgi:drug/metabolite transporter (DMT)-like permease
VSVDLILTINLTYLRKNFGATVFTLIMTTRILVSIALSCVLYGHQVSATGFFGLMLVLSAVLYRIRRKAQGQQLLKWQGMEDGTKTFELVQEWHEHVEM